MSEKNYEYSDMIYLLWCAVNKCAPEKKYIRSADVENLLKMSVSHKLTLLMNEAVKKADDSLFSSEDKGRFETEALKALRVNLLFDYDTKNVLALLEKNKISCMPLKGYVLKEYYPQAEQRQMGDIDILIAPEDADKIRGIMVEAGYSCTSFNETHHDSYFKKPFYLYEFHRTLFLGAEKKWDDYYRNIIERLQKNPENEYEYSFSPEDMYIYIVMHGLKHFLDRGTGLRFLTDIYFYLKAEKIDFDYVENEMKKLDVYSYERLFRDLAIKVFSEESGGHDLKLSKEEEKALYELYSSGAYGSTNVAVTHRMERLTNGTKGNMKKPVYVLKRFFIIPEIYRLKYPKMYKSVVLRPVLVGIRLVKGMKSKRHLIANELKVLKKYPSDSSEKN